MKRNKAEILVILNIAAKIKSTIGGIKSKMDMTEEGISESKGKNEYNNTTLIIRIRDSV